MTTTTPTPSTRPHWSARIEDKKNLLVAEMLTRAGWQPRLQPYASYGSTTQIRVLGRVLFAGPHSAPDHHDQPVYDMRSLARRGFRNFMSQVDPHANVEIVIDSLDGPVVTRVESDRSGIIDTIVKARMAPGIHEVTLRTNSTNAVTGDLHIFDESAKQCGIVSDVDDTVLVTFLPRPALAAWNAFVVDQASRRIVPGMPVLYQQLSRSFGPNTPFVYLSTGAWNVFPVLQRFLFKNGYPSGPLLLTDWGPTNTGLFRSGYKHKMNSLAQLRDMFPNTTWLLIGDDGQHDPQIYGEFTANNPNTVRAVAIRELTDEQQDLAHGAERPFRSIGAFFRVIADLIPKVWHKTDPPHRVAHPRPETIHTAGEGRKDAAAAPPPAARNAAVPWVSAPDGFGLIRALRKVHVLESPSTTRGGAHEQH